MILVIFLFIYSAYPDSHRAIFYSLKNLTPFANREINKDGDRASCVLVYVKSYPQGQRIFTPEHKDAFLNS